MKRKLFFCLSILISLSTTIIAQTSYLTIPALQADSMIKANLNNPDFIIIDVRTSSEFYNMRISDNALNLDYYSVNFSQRLDSLDKTKVYLIYCGSGSRSGATLTILETLKFQTVYNLQNGVKGYKEAGLPLLSVPVGIYQMQEKTGSFSIYPNPANDLIHIRSIDNSSSTNVVIVNTSGAILMNKNIFENRINIDDLPNGNYFVILNNLSGRNILRFMKSEK